LLIAAVAALGIANSRLAPDYHALLETPFGLQFGSRHVAAPMHFWINDGLMTIFFFVVGLEIRREIHEGELATLRRSALPIVAALGGMVAPAVIYLAVVGRHAALRRGWGIPMATDIAFAVGVLALLGRRVPPALRVLLLALAIIDDIGSIVVIAVFYSSAFHPDGLGVVALGLAVTVAFQRFGFRRAPLYVIPGAIVWLGALRSGVHPTIAGVAMGLLTPAHPWFGARGFVSAARDVATHVEEELGRGAIGQIAPEELASGTNQLELARREALAPAVRLQVALHPWVAFGIMPLFALANAGVAVRGDDAFAVGPAAVGVALGLVLGKPIGILLACIAAERAGVAILPAGVRYRELVVLGIVAGIGFTMAIFIASLAFAGSPLLAQAKVAILVASGVAGALGLMLGRLLLPATYAGGAARSARDAECSDAL